jgi:hypothetical protein
MKQGTILSHPAFVRAKVMQTLQAEALMTLCVMRKESTTRTIRAASRIARDQSGAQKWSASSMPIPQTAPGKPDKNALRAKFGQTY